ncbi:hypothetical protein [Nocardia sp. X0981]
MQHTSTKTAAPRPPLPQRIPAPVPPYRRRFALCTDTLLLARIAEGLRALDTGIGSAR